MTRILAAQQILLDGATPSVNWHVVDPRTLTPSMDECPSGGSHAPIPKQGGGGNVCTKCGNEC